MEPTVLLYNVSPEKEKIIQSLCQKLSVRAVSIPQRRHGCTIGQALRGEGSDRPAQRPFADEMLVLQLPGILMDFFLQGLQSEGADVPLKAAITPTNVSWTADALVRELYRERQEFLRRGAK